MKVRTLHIVNWKSFADSGELTLDDINILVGRNNSGKSAVLRALYLMQNGANPLGSDIRLLSEPHRSEVNMTFSGHTASQELRRYFGLTRDTKPETLTVKVNRQGGSLAATTRVIFNASAGGDGFNGELISNSEPANYVYPYLAGRKVQTLDTQVDSQRTRAVGPDLRNLAAKVFRLADSTYVGHAEFTALCDQILGFRVSTYAGENGQKVGISIGRHDHIAIDAMGEGVASQLGLIVDLCMADGNLVLIEELENDIHPQALKTILQVIIQKSKHNQFVISTHNNIVLKYLGAEPNARIFTVESALDENKVPTSTIRQVKDEQTARMQVLRQLGYELHDFDFHEGYLFLEESSAQTIIRDYLVRWFASRLTRIQIVATGGVDRINPFFEDFRRLFLFAHLDSHYQGRAWVVADGDEVGKVAIDRLRKNYKTWPIDHFRTWSESDFERYFPARFQERVEAVLAMNHGDKRSAKKQLLADVTAWCDAHPSEAEKDFAESAREVIDFLQEIDHKLFGAAPQA